VDLHKTRISLHSLIIFRNLSEDAVIQSFAELLYADFMSKLFRHTTNWSEYLFSQLLANESEYVKQRAVGRTNDRIEHCVALELKALEGIAQVSGEEVLSALELKQPLPVWEVHTIDFATSFMQRMEKLKQTGYGIFVYSHMFRLVDGSLIAVKSPDPIQLSDLKGYDAERQKIVNNTLALIDGKPAANVLLYGDAGTGKSSTVKAAVNAFQDKGLRLVELTKHQLREIPALIDRLSENPLKFIVFIDDLSFSEENDHFNGLKAVLEGSVSAKPSNVVIYATSNRRHLIKESFSDREGDDVHRNETIQELCSLSERFGLTVGFFKPNKLLYLKIVRELKEQYCINISDEELESRAESFALAGRSPRTAKQFIDSILCSQGGTK